MIQLPVHCVIGGATLDTRSIMDFIDRLKALSASANARVAHARTEEATKTALVLPFLQVLGYDVFDPREVMPEYVADVGTKRGEKVDYAVLRDGEPIIIIECKAVGVPLDVGKITQLFRYFANTAARFGILTDGMVYQFYSDLEAPNKMDTKPFLEFDLSEITKEDAQNLKRFAKDSFSLEDSLRAAETLKYTVAIKWVLDDLMRRPHRDFVRFILDQVHGGLKTQALIDKFTDITKQALREFINDKISARLQTALQDEDEGEAPVEDPREPEPPEPDERTPEVVTTEDELRAYEIIKEILKDTVADDRVVLQDRVVYCNVVLDGRPTKNIMRMYLHRKKEKIVRLYDDSGQWVQYPVESPEDIFEYAEAIRARTMRLLEAG